MVNTLGVVIFILGHWVHWGAPSVWSGSSMVTGFNGVRHGVHRVHPGSLGSQGCTRGAVGFIRGRWIHWGAPWVSSGSSGVTGFTGVRPGVRRVHPGSLASLECALGAIGFGFIRCRWVHWDASWFPLGLSAVAMFVGVLCVCRRFHPGLLGSLGCALDTVE